MKCWNCGKYTFDEHDICVECGESYPNLKCETEKCKELHV